VPSPVDRLDDGEQQVSTLIVRPGGGLCNRMRALLSGVSYAEVTGRSLRYAWARGPQFEASLDDLWVNDLRTVPGLAVSVLSRLVGGYTAPDDVRVGDRRRLIVVNSSDVIARDEPGLVPWIDRLRQLPLHPDLRARVQTTMRSWPDDRPVVGIMIRSNLAHAQTVEASPVEWFLARMHEIRAVAPDVVFFLSADDPAVSARVRDAFDDVTELAGKSPYNSVGGVQDAACDLYLLASGNYLVGSHWSSFSDTAGALAVHGGYETSRLEPTSDLPTCLARPRVACLPGAPSTQTPGQTPGSTPDSLSDTPSAPGGKAPQ
jgi:hypothetical protein